MRLLLFVVSLGLTLPAARGQWIHFLDRSEARLVLAAEGDSKEKDCAVGDFDRDGWTDIVVVRKAPFKTPGGAVDLLLMNRGGVLTDETAAYAPEFLTTLTDARDVFVSDLDGDSWPDLILANTFGDQPVCYRNRGSDGNGNWQGFVDESATRLPFIDIPDLQFCAVCAADITGDGAPELYFTNYVRAPKIALDVLLVNDGFGHFTDASEARLGILRQSAFGTSIDMRDMDNDGDLDIVKTSSLNAVPPWNEIGVFLLFNEGSGTFTEFQSVPTDSPYMFAVDDLNNDDLLDLYIVNDSQDYAVRNAGYDPAQAQPVQFEKTVLQNSPRTFFLGGNLQCADFDNDGDLDVAVADVDIDIGICETAPDDPRKFALLRNEGEATGELADPWGLNANPWNTNVFDFGVLDIDRDGKLDLFLAECDGYSVFMQEHVLHLSGEELSFDHVIAGTSVQETLSICNNGPAAVEVTGLTVDDVRFTLSDSAWSLAPYECRELTVTFAPTLRGDYGATLQVEAGEFSRTVTLRGTVVTPPRARLPVSVVEGTLEPDGVIERTVVLFNDGGSELEFDIQVRIPGAPPERVLLIADPSAEPLLGEIVRALPHEFASIGLDELASVSLEDHDTIVLALTSSGVSAHEMELLGAAAASGKTLLIIGASTDPEFREGLQGGLLLHNDEPGWKEPTGPQFQVVEVSHPLADGLPATHDFNSNSASWYRIQPDDPEAWVAAVNGDGIPCLLSKQIGAGSLVYFTNWPLGVVWDNPVDRPLLEMIVRNAIGSAPLAWLSIDPRRDSILPGESLPIVVSLNARGRAPGHYRAELVIGTNDLAQAELVVEVSLEVTDGAGTGTGTVRLEVEAVDGDAVTLSLRGEVGVRYRIERSEDLVSWEGIGEVLGQPGPVPFADAGVQGRPSAFFRAVSLP